MTVQVRNAPVYAMVTLQVYPQLRNAPVYLLSGLWPELPKNILGKDSFLQHIREKAMFAFRDGELEVGLPEPTTEHGCNTRVLVRSTTVRVQGEMYFFYNRATLSRLPLPGNFALQSETMAHELLARINTATGMILDENDLVNSAKVGNKITLTGGNNSYFFLPGSSRDVT